MTEQEYCDLSDLQSCRAILQILHTMNVFEEPNKARHEGIIENIVLMINELQPKISLPGDSGA